MLKGSLVALVTPMLEDLSIDYNALEKLIKWHIKEGTNAIVCVGTTGESTTLSLEEHIKVVEFTTKIVDKKIPVIAGTGANNTNEAIYITKYAQKYGANMGLSVAPYYNKPSQDGIYAHFEKIAKSVNLPLILYNVPSRTVVDINNDTILKLSKIKNIIGLKDATGNLARFCALKKEIANDFLLYSGDDSTCLPFMLCGGHGTITVTGNIAPSLFSKMCSYAINKNVEMAIKLNNMLLELHSNLFIEPSPAPTKWALAQLKLCNEYSRLPIIKLSPNGQQEILKAMKSAKII